MVADSIQNYVPRSIDPDTWERVAPRAREWVTALGVEVGPQAVQRLKPLAQYLAWRHEGGMSIDAPNEVFKADDVETFFREGCQHLAVGTRSTYRSALRTIGERVAGFEVACPGRTLPIAKHGPNTPYSPTDFAAILSAIRGRASASQRHNAMVLVALARGAGLSAGDIASLVGTDVRRTGDGGVAIHLPGAEPRIAIPLASWEDRVLELATAAGTSLLFRPNRAQVSRNDIARFCDRLAWTDAPRLSVTRLRITWIVGHLTSGTPIAILSRATGVTPMSLARYACFGELCSSRTAEALLRHPRSPA